MMTALALILVLAVVTGGCGNPNPRIVFKTDLGSVEVELYPKNAPVTSANFARYVRESRLDGAVFYRVVRDDNQPGSRVKIAVIQGGLKNEDHPALLPPIEHETTSQTGIRHLDGTISMARWGPGTATVEFFICVGDQPELDFGGRRNPDGQGFAAFGRVTRGMDVVGKIHNSPAEGQTLTPEIKITSVELLDG